ncbi:MAG: FtsX-like permease family protein, partial [Terriglobales bacterium]
ASDVRATLQAAPPDIGYVEIGSGFPISPVEMVVRSALPPGVLASQLRRAVWSVAPLAPVPKIYPLSALVSEAVAPQQYQLTLLLLFAIAALILAAIGVYALVSHSVAQRNKELAIRITMGAKSGDVWRLILHQALTPVIAGIIAGLIVAVLAGRLMASLLFAVSPASPPVLAAVAAAVLAAAVVACLAPAWRATRTDPLNALRAD